ncbi:MAG TPA: exonuclease domain-containing protein [Pyrinomonadaceae bacterium]|nr:exonuclease domain-containing protein [Pyrinomonadaceae bacterium]
MPLPSNLIPDSAEAEEAVALLRLAGGRSRVERVAEVLFQISDLDPLTAHGLVSEFLKDDWRVALAPDGEMELRCEDPEARALGETEFVVFDVETTGSKRPPCRVVEIGLCRVRAGRIVAELETLVNPCAPIPPFISMLTGITDGMVSSAPPFEQVVGEVLGFIGSAVLVAHNASFDVSFLNHEIAQVYTGRKLFNPHICTVSLARRVVPDLANHRLHTVAEHFSIPLLRRHRASDDARATAEVFIRLLNLLDGHGVRDLAGARNFKIDTQARRAAE